MSSSRGRVAIALLVLALLVVIGWLLQRDGNDEHAADTAAVEMSHPAAGSRFAAAAAPATVPFDE